MDKQQRQLEKVSKMTRFADDWAKMSPSLQRKVGCVIFDPWCREVLAFGFNGLGAGLSHDACHADTSKSTGEVHAEINALLKLDPVKVPYRGAVLYVGVQPCIPCAGAIINSRKIGLVLAPMDETACVVGVANLRKVDIPVLEWMPSWSIEALSSRLGKLKEKW